MTFKNSFSVSKADAGQRLDRWLRHYFPHAPFSLFQKWMRTGQIRVQGKRVQTGFRLSENNIVRLPPFAKEYQESSTKKGEITPHDAEKIRKSVIYHDRHFLALNKPAGLAVQGGKTVRYHVNGLLPALCFEASEPPRIVHRLDMGVSGVLMLARHRVAAAKIGEALRQRKVKKTYLALVHGVPKPMAGKINFALTPLGNGLVQSGAEGLYDAETRYRVLDHVGDQFSLMVLRPKTGRKHQLRVHMQAIGTAIIGDRKYSMDKNSMGNLSKTFPKNILFLHALDFTMPSLMGGEEGETVISAPPPEYFTRICKEYALDLDSVLGEQRPDFF